MLPAGARIRQSGTHHTQREENTMQTIIAALNFTAAQHAEMASLKSWRPYMIVGGALNPLTGEFQLVCGPTMRPFNKLARQGWHVVTIGK